MPAAVAAPPTPTTPAAGAGRLPLAAAGVTVALWASAFVGIRSVGEHLAAGPLALARLLVGALVLGVIMRIRGERLPPRAALPGVVLCGVGWFAAYNVLLNAAERRVDAGTAAMLVNVGPVFIAVLAGWLLREGFPRTLLAGCGVALGGAVLIGAATAHAADAAVTGAVLCVLAALAYAGGVVAQKPTLAHAGALPVTFTACVVGAIACLPWAPQLADQAGHASAGTLLGAAYLGLFPTAIAFTTWAYALSHTSAGRLGATTYLVPPLAVGLAWLLLGETPPGLAVAGGALCLAGVVVARR